jgi:hypothetical protein
VSLDWLLRAACHGQPYADWAFGGGPEQHAFIARYCNGCPVTAECLEYGREHPGVYGGKTRQQRGYRPPPDQRLAPCGTPAAYDRHRRNGEDACDPCRLANTEQSRRQYARAHGKQPPRDTGACGTYAGYQRHRKAGQSQCDACMAAQRSYEAELRPRKRAG